MNPSPFEEKLRAFVEDEVMFNAVRGILLSNCDLNTVFRSQNSEEVENDQFFQACVAKWKARELIEKSFKDLAVYRKPQTEKTDIANPAV